MPSLRVQIVLYRNDPELFERSFEAVVNALNYASSEAERWTLALGDSSPEPVLSDALLKTLEARAVESGKGSFSYDFFNENLGHGGGHNRLHSKASEDLLLILNPDGFVAPDCIVELIRALTPEVGIVDARQLPMEHPKQYDAVTGEASWSSLACALTRSVTFREVGGLDHDTFFMYCDDVDYSWRVRLSGLKACYCPQARMFHDKRLNSDGVMGASESELYYSVEASFMLAYKYSRDDVLKKLVLKARRSSDQTVLNALSVFEGRQSSDNLPTRLDARHEVAEFTGGTYGEHRF